MDLKNILQNSSTCDDTTTTTKDKDIPSDKKNESENNEPIRMHKKPVQLRDIENRSSNTTRQSSLFDTEEDIKDFLINERKSSLKKQWNKLDIGMKIGRLKLFCEEEQKIKCLSEEEKEILSKMLIMACHSSKINRNTDVQYDTNECKIITIKPLVFDITKRKYTLNITSTSNKKNDKPKSKSQIDRFIKKSNKK